MASALRDKLTELGHPILSKRAPKGNAFNALCRTIFGVSLTGLSFWGIHLCQELFRTFIGSTPSPVEANCAKLAGWATWFVFFGPIAVAGLAILWSVLLKLNSSIGLSVLGQRSTSQLCSLHSEKSLQDGLERLRDEEVRYLTKRANQIAFMLGVCAGVFFLLVGVFGLILASWPSLTVTTYSAMLSGISFLTGAFILQRTFRKEDDSWLLPLKMFMLRVFQLGSLSAADRKIHNSEHLR